MRARRAKTSIKIIHTLDKAAAEVGVNFLGGYSALVEKVHDSGRRAADPVDSSGACGNRACLLERQCWIDQNGYQYGCGQADGRSGACYRRGYGR
ncbi:MAG: DUF711 family protein [Slackia sp.]